ncbi:hypothetical protein [Geoglobus sp.]
MGKRFTKEIRIGRIRILYHEGIESHILKHENVKLSEAREALNQKFVMLHLGGTDYMFIAQNPYSGKYITVFLEKISGSTLRLKTIRLSTSAEKKYYNKKSQKVNQ